MKRFNIGIAIVAIGLLAAACVPDPPKESKKNAQAKNARAAAQALNITHNYEIKNIQRRVAELNKPGLVGYVVLLNEAGQPIWYGASDGKPTSGSKRLTRKWKAVRMDCGTSTCQRVVDASGEDGTHGSSNPYVYFWTAGGQYMQWSGKYLYSTQPLRLTIEPLVVDMAGRK